MRDGTFTFYCIEHRRVRESPWSKPFEHMVDVRHEHEDWGGTGSDSWGHIAEPKIGTGNERRSKYKKSSEENYEVWCATGHTLSYWTRKYAERAIKRLQKANNKGVFNSMEQYSSSTPYQSMRYEFRLLKMTMSQNTEILKTFAWEDTVPVETAK